MEYLVFAGDCCCFNFTTPSSQKTSDPFHSIHCVQYNTVHLDWIPDTSKTLEHS